MSFTIETNWLKMSTLWPPAAGRIFEERGTTCHEFEKGSWQCLEFRGDAGLSTALNVADSDADPCATPRARSFPDEPGISRVTGDLSAT